MLSTPLPGYNYTWRCARLPGARETTLTGLQYSLQYWLQYWLQYSLQYWLQYSLQYWLQYWL